MRLRPFFLRACVLAPRLLPGSCLGAHCLRGSASRGGIQHSGPAHLKRPAGRACKTVRSQAEPGSEKRGPCRLVRQGKKFYGYRHLADRSEASAQGVGSCSNSLTCRTRRAGVERQGDHCFSHSNLLSCRTRRQGAKGLSRLSSRPRTAREAPPRGTGSNTKHQRIPKVRQAEPARQCAPRQRAWERDRRRNSLSAAMLQESGPKSHDFGYVVPA